MKNKIITIAQQKGGSGKTTLTAHLAFAALRCGLRTGILDTDPQGSLGRWFMARCERLGETQTGFSFRTASAWGARFEAQQMLKECDTVFIDTPPKMGSDGRPSIAVADIVIIPVSPSPLDLWATEPTLELIKSEKTPMCAVVVRSDARTRMTRELDEHLDNLGLARTPSRIANRVAFAEAMQAGKTVMELRPSSPASMEVKAVYDEIKQRVEQIS